MLEMEIGWLHTYAQLIAIDGRIDIIEDVSPLLPYPILLHILSYTHCIKPVYISIRFPIYVQALYGLR